ncbi:TPA: hypothetical protein RQJ16_001763 [Campylobacter fetus subsp. venerealis]|nr:hypothetical protein [Campylobacter fetus subsp. venerealis]HDX6311489.1 hypothetical protein [Campylobacter fetus subsp. venerealis]HDX6321115.1 hypothetical protein [Campylobacter fetus subsp. venerealis]HDX6323098.1 hypothetical protein [Campylobacter fetus subsp. venerealis]HDX8135916.1 hypothetical protein [Campylobacter fetus subsp. venerealis]
MKKVIVLIVFSVVYVFACGGCRDQGLGQQLGQISVQKFDILDKETAEKINEIVKKIHKAHQDLEVENKNILIQNQKLAALEAVLEKQIVFNQDVINKLQGVLNTKESEKGFFEK